MASQSTESNYQRSAQLHLERLYPIPLPTLSNHHRRGGEKTTEV